MKKFFANIDNGNLYEDPHIKEVEYDHFADKSESIVVGYDGNVLPVRLQRSEKKNIRFLGIDTCMPDIERYKEVFRSRRDRYRRWRDLSFFVMLGVYALSVIDAYVDASLSTFDISDDLSLHVQPAIINNKMTVSPNSPLSNNAIGIRSSLKF
jgi:hypothetical protein